MAKCLKIGSDSSQLNHAKCVYARNILQGMVQAAAYLKSKLLGENILDKAFEMCQTRSNETFNIVIVGHSLGGGAAAILAILLREQFPTLVCYAFSPPGGLLR